jgi:WD40 repeat protein
MNRNQNQPLPSDAVLGGMSPPPFRGVVLGGMDGVKWRIQNSTDSVKIAALEDALKYSDRGKSFLANLVETETELLLWSAYHLLWQADKENLSFSDRTTVSSLTEQGMQKRFGSGKLIDAIALTEKLTILLTSAGASLLDVNSDRLVWEIDCPTECANVSPDRTNIAIGWKHHIYLWNLRNGDLIQDIEIDRGWVYSLVFSPDSKLIAARVSGDRAIALWDVNSGKLIRKLEGHTSFVKSLVFSPDGALLASGGWNNIIRFWNLSSGTQLRRIEEEDGLRRIGEHLVFSPDSKLLAVSSDRYFGRDDGVRLLDVSSGNPLQLLKSHQQPIVNLTFSENSKLLISQSKDKTVNWWDLLTGNKIEDRDNFDIASKDLTLREQTNLPVSSSPRLLVSPNHSTIVQSHKNYGDRLEKLEQSIDSINNFALSPDNLLLATSNDRHQICLWDLNTGERLNLLEGHQEAIERIAFSADGEILATASKDKTVKLWDVVTGKHLKTLVGHQHWVSDVVFSPDRRSIATSSWDKTVRIWDIASGCQQQILFGHKGCVRSVNFSPDGSLLASGGSDKRIFLWDVASGKQIRTIRAYRDILNVTFSPDGTVIASGGWDYFGTGNTLRFWDVSKGKQVKFLEDYSRTVHSIAFSSDGQFLATGGGDMAVTLWDLATGERVKVLFGHTRSVTNVAFSNDEKLVISGSGDRTVRVWNLDPREELTLTT